MFSIKEVANSLQISTQAVYKQIPRLEKEGKAYREQNKMYITQEGFNELQDRRVANYNVTELKEVAQPSLQPFQDLGTVSKELFDIVQEQLKDMQNQRDYFKSLYEQKDKAFNEIVNQRLLSGTVDEQRKSSLWSKLFNKI